MFKRKIVVQTLVAAVVLLIFGTNVLKAQPSDVDIERLEIIFQKGFDDGVSESPLPWGLEIYTDLVNDESLDHIDITKVGNTMVGTVNTHVDSIKNRIAICLLSAGKRAWRRAAIQGMLSITITASIL